MSVPPVSKFLNKFSTLLTVSGLLSINLLLAALKMRTPRLRCHFFEFGDNQALLV